MTRAEPATEQPTANPSLFEDPQVTEAAMAEATRDRRLGPLQAAETQRGRHPSAHDSNRPVQLCWYEAVGCAGLRQGGRGRRRRLLTTGRRRRHHCLRGPPQSPQPPPPSSPPQPSPPKLPTCSCCRQQRHPDHRFSRSGIEVVWASKACGHLAKGSHIKGAAE